MESNYLRIICHQLSFFDFLRIKIDKFIVFIIMKCYLLSLFFSYNFSYNNHVNIDITYA